MISAAVPSTAELFNAADYLVDRQVREGGGDRTAVIARAGVRTYRELADEMHRIAGGLRSCGLRPGERLLLCMADDVEFLTALLAGMYLGAIPVPVSTMMTGTELGALFTDSGAKILCASTEFTSIVDIAMRRATNISTLIFDSEPVTPLRCSVAAHRWEVLRRAESVDTAYPTTADSPALWLYTSGTTGRPKAAMHRHRSVRTVAENYGTRVLGISPGDRCLSVAKMFFAYGIGNSCILPLSAGATTVLERARPTPAVIAARLLNAQPTVFFGVPTFYSRLLVAPELPLNPFGTVRQAVSAGEPLPAPLFTQCRERFGIEVLDGIGSTEAFHIFMSNRPGCAQPGSSGVPVPGYDVQLRDESDVPIATTGAPGELYVRGNSIASGYWRRPEDTRRVFRGDWLCTGDIYVRNNDDSYTCLGRSGDMLKAGGIWVSPREVEERLLKHPDVVEAALIGAVDDVGLEKPVACVVIRCGATVDGDGLIDWCRDGLAAFKRPRAVVTMAELPKTPTGKVRRNELRRLVARLRFDLAEG